MVCLKNAINFIVKRFLDNFYSSLFWGTLSAVFIQGSNFLVNIVLARILGVEIGQLTLLITANATLQTFSLLGLNVSSTVIVSKCLYKRVLGRMIQSIYTITICMTLIISLGSLLIDNLSFENFSIWGTDSKELLFYCVIWLLTSVIDTVQISILIGLRAFKGLAVISLIKGFFSVVVILLLVTYWGVTGAVLGYALSFLCSLLGNAWLINKKIKFSFYKVNSRYNRKILKYILRSSLPIFFAALFISPAFYFSNAYIYSREEGKLCLSVFYIAYQWLILIQFFPTQIARVILPLLSATVNTNSCNTEKKGFYLSFAICFFLIVMSLLFDKYIIVDLFNFEYESSFKAFNIVCIAALFSTFNIYYGNIILATGAYWHRTVADAIIALGIIIFTIVFCSYSVSLALPLALLISYILGDIYLYIARKKCLLKS